MTVVIAQAGAWTPGDGVAFCWLVTFLVAVLLGVGWRVRSRVLVWLSICLGVLVGLPLGIRTAIDLGRADAAVLAPAPLFRIAVVAWLALLAAAVHRDHAFRRRRKAEIAQWIERHGTLYDHEWLLSLLQSRTGESQERVSRPVADGGVAAGRPRDGAEA